MARHSTKSNRLYLKNVSSETPSFAAEELEIWVADPPLADGFVGQGVHCALGIDPDQPQQRLPIGGVFAGAAVAAVQHGAALGR